MFRIIVKNATTGKELLWRHVVVRKSLDDICHTLDLELEPDERTKVRKHHRIEVRCANPLINDSQRAGGRLVTTVLVDEVTAGVDEQKHGVTVKGRSPARDIIDSTWSEDFADMTFLQLTRAIGKRFGIPCDIFPLDDDQTEHITAFRLENESPWVKLINEADNEGYVFTSNEAGRLYLWKVAAVVRSEGFKLVEGVNIKTIGWSENGAEQFHEYVVQGVGGAAQAIDPTCPGSRILTINITDPDFSPSKLQRRADTEKRRRQETRVTVAVPGWGLSDAEIKRLGGQTIKKEVFWIPNALIPVSMPSLGLDTKLLISEVEQEATPDAFGSTITLVNRETYL